MFNWMKSNRAILGIAGLAGATVGLTSYMNYRRDRNRYNGLIGAGFNSRDASSVVAGNRFAGAYRDKDIEFLREGGMNQDAATNWVNKYMAYPK